MTLVPRIESGIGRLRHVVTHRPGRELERPTPSTIHRLLFDDVPWAGRACAEHDAFVEASPRFVPRRRRDVGPAPALGELGRGGEGSCCMTCPIVRDPVEASP